MSRGRTLLLAVGVLAAMAVPASAGTPADGLADCPATYDGPFRCGSIQVPTSSDDPALGTRTIDFVYRPADVQPAVGTTIFSDGPIQSTFSEASPWKPGYYSWIANGQGALASSHDVILVNTRGTGRDAVNCPLLQTPGSLFSDAVPECVGILGSSIDWFTIGDAADDIEAVRTHLLGSSAQVDLVAMGHETSWVDAYLARYPQHARSAILDDAVDFTAWNEGEARDGTRILGLICNQSTRCSAAVANPIGEIAWLADRVRRSPITGLSTLADGTPQRIRIDEYSLAWGLVVGDGQQTLAKGAGLPAAIRAYRRGDSAPLLRLAANAGIGEGLTGPPTTDPNDAAVDWSGAGLATAWCNEWPAPFDRSAGESARRAQAVANLAKQPRDLYGVFSRGIFTSHGLYAYWDECWAWPAAKRVNSVHPAGIPYPQVPVLVMSGDLNAEHPQSASRRVASRYPNSAFVTIPRANQPSLRSSPCAARIAAHFIETLSAGDTTCAPNEGTTVLGIGVFPKRAADETPARAASGNDGSSLRDRKVAAAAVHTWIDAVAQAWFVGADSGPALRGGSWKFTDNGDSGTWTFDSARFVGDVAVTGSATISYSDADPPADLVVTGHGTERGELHVEKPTFFSLDTPTAHVTGRIGRHPIDVIVDLH